MSHDNGENTDDDGPKTTGRAGATIAALEAGKVMIYKLWRVIPLRIAIALSIFSAGNIFGTNQYNARGEDTRARGSIGGLCSTTDIQIGHWVNVTMDVPPYTPMPGEVQDKTCPGFKPNEIFHTWEWEPDVKCEFTRYDSNSFCNLTKNMTLAIIGDSISFDHYLSVTHLLGAPKALPKARNHDALLTSQVCNGNTLLIGKRDFYLNHVEEIINQYSPDVLVLNRGAHYVPNDELLNHMVNKVFPQLNQWQQKMCTEKERDCLLIWRTTVPGHPDCAQYNEPSNSVAEMEELVNSYTNSGYNWEKFKIQNQLVLEAFAHTNLTYEVMDSYFINILRPDMHPSSADCLHTVGPVASYTSFLQHVCFLCVSDIYLHAPHLFGKVPPHGQHV